MSRRASPAPITRRSAMPVWAAIGWRVTAVVALLALAIGVHWFDRAGLRDNLDGEVSFVDVVYFTMISITTTGYGDITPVSDRARLFDALVVTPIRVFVVLLFIGTAYQFVLRRTWERWRMAHIQRTLHGHVVVAGYGATGSEAIDELIARGERPGNFVVIDQDEGAIARAKACGCTVLHGDATRDDTLSSVHIERARALIASAGRDDTSILITLSARHLAPDLPISVVVRNEDNEFPARAAGATTVINPVSFAGLLLANACSGRHLADYLADLASANGRVALVERRATAAEAGRPIAAVTTGVVLRVYRDGEPLDLTDPGATMLAAGDVIVEVVQTTPTPA